MILTHILLGTPTLEHGNLRFTTRAAGSRGERTSIEIIEGGAFDVSIQIKGLGEGAILITIPVGMSEADLILALNTSDDFKKLAQAAQSIGNGDDPVQALLPSTFAAVGGLKQRLTERLLIQKWDDVDQLSTGAPVGLIHPHRARCERIGDDEEYWNGTVQVSVMLQLDQNFESSNATLDLFRRALHRAIRLFRHDALSGFGPFDYSYSNSNKDEVSGTKLDGHRLRVDGVFGAKWVETAEDNVLYPFDHIQMGLFREPLDDELGGPGEEIKDTDFILED